MTLFYQVLIVLYILKLQPFNDFWTNIIEINNEVTIFMLLASQMPLETLPFLQNPQITYDNGYLVIAWLSITTIINLVGVWYQFYYQLRLIIVRNCNRCAKKRAKNSI